MSMSRFTIDYIYYGFTTNNNRYRITGIIRGRKVSRIVFFSVVREKTFAIQVILLYKNSSQDRKCKKTFANASRFAKFAKLFFREWFPLYGIHFTIQIFLFFNRPEVRITIILKQARTVTICNIFSTGSSLNKINISDMWRRIYSFEIFNTVPGFVRKISMIDFLLIYLQLPTHSSSAVSTNCGFIGIIFFIS